MGAGGIQEVAVSRKLSRLLVANRGEIAIRVMRAAAELDIPTLAVYPEDDAGSLHTKKADEAVRLPGQGARAYLNIEAILEVAREHGCDALHPGYGFLSENAGLARRCGEVGIVFVGPRADTLELFGDKVRARSVAAEHGVPVLEGTSDATSLDDARAFFASLAEGEAMIIKAVAGGGGRGVRVVRSADEIEAAHERARSEARAAFGNPEVYLERFLPQARHIEVQIAGDASGEIAHFWERDCSLQRRHQKVVEFAPSPALPADTRARILQAAVRLGRESGYTSLGTFEFLVDAASGDDTSFAFLEANARLQVEHTVTEEVTGVDLVQLQLQLAAGRTLADLGLAQEQVPPPRGFAVEARVNMETMRPDGMASPAGGTLTAFEPPSGHGVRTDSFGYAGYATSPRYDSLLAKLIAHSPSSSFLDAVTRADRALAEFRVEGVSTNISFLRALLEHPAVRAGRVNTRFIDEHIGELVASSRAERRTLHAGPAPLETRGEAAERALAGVKVDQDDPLAVLAYGREEGAARRDAMQGAKVAAPIGTAAVEAPLQGTVVSIEVAEGDAVRADQLLLIMEAMKMEHEVRAPASGILQRVEVEVGDTIYEGHTLFLIEEGEVEGAATAAERKIDLDHIRDDLRQVLDRRATTRDEERPVAVERRHSRGQRTVQENVEQLFDPGTIIEYGPLVLAAQRARRSIPELVEKSPRDGMVTAVGSVNGQLFPDPVNRVATIAYDYSVFAGTQGAQNHRKTDRMIKVAREARLPLVLFAEGGGGRPGDTEGHGGGPGDTRSFSQFATLSGLVPMIGITSGRCFAGNASLLGCCDVIIATASSNIGMGGPAMVEGGGLGVFAPEDIGGMDVQVPNGVVDIAVEDEIEAVAVAKRYLSYFQGRTDTWEAPDQRLMRRIVPENRLRVYEVRQVIETLGDVESVLEIRKGFGVGMVTSLIRVEGYPLGVVANNPRHLGGAIDSDGADKAARFVQLCDAFDLPVLYLCDTPGIMVGPEVERTALVRHANRLFLVGANVDTLYMTVVLRKAYGLGAIAMAGGSYKEPAFTVSWPTGEFGGMGLEGAVKLGYRNELAAIEEPQARVERYEQMVAQAYEHGKALNQASLFGVDDSIDPAETRTWVANTLKARKPPPPRTAKKRPFVDGW
jgi:acetyl/propionyl-CoA carboxylase alpha subunit/acetyl-CoA carboxylase carboxyltransferase component